MTKINTQEADWATTQTHWLLEQWSRWSRVDTGVAASYPSITPFRRLQGSTVANPLISDIEAMRVERALETLRKRFPRRFEAVVRYYLGNKNSMAAVARQMQVHRSAAETWFKTGMAWLDGVLMAKEAA